MGELAGQKERRRLGPLPGGIISGRAYPFDEMDYIVCHSTIVEWHRNNLKGGACD